PLRVALLPSATHREVHLVDPDAERREIAHALDAHAMEALEKILGVRDQPLVGIARVARERVEDALGLAAGRLENGCGGRLAGTGHGVRCFHGGNHLRGPLARLLSDLAPSLQLTCGTL